MKVFGPFPDQAAAHRWAHAKWGDGAYMIKEVLSPSPTSIA
jgi:hypothetical protein